MYAKIVNNEVAQTQPYYEDGFVEVANNVVCGMILQNGEFVNPPKTQEQLDAEARIAKQALLDSIIVTTSTGKAFDGREKDVPLMSGAIQSADVLGLTEHIWKLHDNTVQIVTLAELKEALALAMQKIGEIKTS